MTQQASQWCWAACIEMIFRRYGFVIPQWDAQTLLARVDVIPLP